jgi:hypothetical protein
MRSSARLAASAPPGVPRRVVNVCFSYTSTEELGAALARLRRGLAGWQLLPGDVGWPLVQSALHTGAPRAGGSPPVDLVIRTSGEERLSDFLLWQSGGALLQWLPVLWPRLSFLDLLRAVRAWRAARPALAALAATAAEREPRGRGGSGVGGGAAAGGGDEGRGGDAAGAGGGGGSGACGGGPCGGSPKGTERAASAALSAISEDEPSCAPHPSQQLRFNDFLRGLEAQRQDWIRQTLEAAGEWEEWEGPQRSHLVAPAS